MSAAAIHPRLAARRARTRRIRRTVVALSVALFLATWAFIFGTLISGHDPALGASSSADATARKSVATYPSSSRTGSSSETDDGLSGLSDSGSSSGSSSSGSSSSSSGSAPSVSTQQS